MKWIKRIVIAVVLLVVLLVGLVVFGLSQVDAAAKAAIEKGGTYAMGVDTKVASVSVKLRDASVSLSGLSIANPQGFTSPTFVQLPSAGVSLKAESLSTPIIELPSLELTGLTVNLERKSGASNYQVILDNLKKLQGSGGKPAQSTGQEKKLVINKVEIRDTTIKADMLGLGAASPTVTVPISRISLSNVGKGQGGVADSGVTAEELASIIVQAILAAAVENGEGLIPTEMLGDLKGGLAQLDGLKNIGVETIGKAGETAKQLGASLQDATKSVEDATKGVKDAADKIKNLIPGGR